MPSESYLVARAPRTSLRAALERRTGPFPRAGADKNASDDDVCYLGESRELSYFFDGQLTLLAPASADLVVNLSRELASTVAMLHFETVSASYAFVAARSGQLLRFFVSGSDLRKVLSIGSPLPSEVTHALDSREGLYAALESVGLELSEDWFDHDDLVHLEHPLHAERLEHEDSELGLERMHKAHRAEHAMASDEWAAAFKPVLVPSSNGSVPGEGEGFELRMVPAAEVPQMAPALEVPQIAPALEVKRSQRSAARRWFFPGLAALVAAARFGLRSMQDAAPTPAKAAQAGFTGSDYAQIAGILVVASAIIFYVRSRARKQEQGSAR
jgi:hypothetical protein